MKAFRFTLLFVMTAVLCGCQAFVNYKFLPREGVRPAEYAVSVDRDISIITSDGVELLASVYRPKVDGRTPTILVRIPVSKTWKNDMAMEAVASFWAGRGYTVVIQGTRGRYRSGGEFYPLRSERQDGIETLQWLARQPWFDGRLGMWGGSAFGYTQWVLADQPGVLALNIQIASTDFGTMFHPGGAFSLESALFWAVRSRGKEDEDPSFQALEKGFNGFPLIEADDRAVGDIPFFNDWATAQPGSAYWTSIDGTDRAANARAPVLLMAGWSDPFLPTQLRDFMSLQHSSIGRVAQDSRLIIGPWTHADPIIFPDGLAPESYRAASLAPSIPWFDHHLLGQPLAATLNAPVRLYVMGENVWRDEPAWPLARARHTAFYLQGDGKANGLQGDGKLLPDLPVKALKDSYRYDPAHPVPSRGGAMLGPRAGMVKQNDVEIRSDVLVYSTPPLVEEVEVTGPISAILFVQTSASNTDFTVKLVDVHPDGAAYNISDGILRRSYAANSDPSEITVELWPTSMLFKRGHQIRVEISSSNFPRYDRNPNTGRDILNEVSPVVANQTLHHSPVMPSRIILPVIPRK
ncbi:CocE/NonD family hydrolase [Herminiimonas glaciei]|uniref:CocE/NonD family hydrolase n=1 Tax=Herminiimonas glaciei TaxID=523788 RepID=A0ABW2IEH0_9BURK